MMILPLRFRRRSTQLAGKSAVRPRLKPLHTQYNGICVRSIL